MVLTVSTAWLRLVAACLGMLSDSAAPCNASRELRSFLGGSIESLSRSVLRELLTLSERSSKTPLPDPRLFIAGKLGGQEMQAVGALLKRYGCTGERWQIVCQPIEQATAYRSSGAFDFLLLEAYEWLITMPDAPSYIKLMMLDDPGLTDPHERCSISRAAPRSSDEADPAAAQRLLLGIHGPGNWSH